MERRFVIFLILSFAILLGSSWLMRVAVSARHRPAPIRSPSPWPKRTRKEQAGKSGKGKPAAGEQEASKDGGRETHAGEAGGSPAEKAPPANPGGPSRKPRSNGSPSARPATKIPYRMLVTLDSRGAALARIELSSPRYCDIDDRSGYLGHLVMNVPRRRQRLPGAGRRAGHPRRRSKAQGGRRHPDRRWQGRLATTSRCDAVLEKNETQARPCTSPSSARERS